MLPVILFIFYFASLLIILTVTVKRKKIALSGAELMLIYACKVTFGCVYGYIFLKAYKGDDTWAYYHESLLQYEKLVHHPYDFLKDFLPFSAFRVSVNFWQGIQYYIEDLEFYGMTKLLALFNIASRGNYYINVLFFDFITIFGLLLLFKLLSGLFSTKKKILIVVLFFLPFTNFWLSGIRAEGLILLCLSVIIYYSYKWFNQKKKFVYLLYITAGLIGCSILRAQALLIFFPAFLCMTMSWKTAKKPIFHFVIVYLLGVAIFFSSMLFFPENNLSMPVIKRQQEFFSLHAKTVLKLDSLQPTPSSFVRVFPQAFSNTFLRPAIWESKGVLQLLSSLDIFLFWILLLITIFCHEKNWKEILNNPLILLFIFYGISQVVLIGYIVPFPGAIVRYKSIPELFLLIAMAALTDYKRLRR